jgi:hypothetical protein
MMVRIVTLIVAVLALHACSKPTGYIVTGDSVVWASYGGSSLFPASGLTYVQRPVDADPNSFRVAAFADWGSDQTSAFFRGAVAGPVNQASFEALDTETARDRTTVWYRGKVIAGADGASFRMISHRYAVDAGAAYYGSTRFAACDLATLQDISVDVDSFAFDENCAFGGGFQIPITDRASFTILRAGYSRDSANIFWRETVVEGADVATFVVPEGMSFGRDAGGCWLGARRVTCLEPAK